MMWVIEVAKCMNSCWSEWVLALMKPTRFLGGHSIGVSLGLFIVVGALHPQFCCRKALDQQHCLVLLHASFSFRIADDGCGSRFVCQDWLLCISVCCSEIGGCPNADHYIGWKLGIL
jgi:hypothetical protein